MRSVQRPLRRGRSDVWVIRSGGRALRAGPWPGGVGDTALLAPFGGDLPPSSSMVRAALADLAATGYRRVLTAALGPTERDAFSIAGFAPVAWLHLLARSLDALPAPPPLDGTLRRARRGELDRLARVDHDAFAPLWRLDVQGITEARRATPSNHLRVAADEQGEALGYAVSGRSGMRGYIQRLAVSPSAQSRGFGTALIVDGLRWLRARGATSALINTQLDNDGALALYLRLGFRLQSDRLVVLGVDLPARS